jgi:septum formation protein
MTAVLVLASASPRRRELLAQLRLSCDVHAVRVEETRLPGEAPARMAARLAEAKALAAAAAIGPDDSRPILGADTVVALGDRVFGKPAGGEEAASMLRELSGRVHEVVTAVAVLRGGVMKSGYSRSEVRFRELHDGEIDAYVASGEPLDKAGAYGIQGLAAMFVAHLAGSYTGVVGLPLCETAALLRAQGLDPLRGREGS